MWWIVAMSVLASGVLLWVAEHGRRQQRRLDEVRKRLAESVKIREDMLFAIEGRLASRGIALSWSDTGWTHVDFDPQATGMDRLDPRPAQVDAPWFPFQAEA